MDMLKRTLAVLVVILIVLAGAGFYLTNTMKHGNINMGTQNQQPNVTTPGTTKQPTVNVILQPDLKNYIDEINKGINLINEANSLITSDSFFADPPKVITGKIDTSDTTPFDKQLPKDRPIVVMPDGTYQIVDNSGSDMREVHRGIYKLGQGMTVLNSVLDRMNTDIKNNNFPIKNNNYAGMQNMTGTDTTGNNILPGTNGGMSNMPGMGTTTINSGFSFGAGTITRILYILVIAFMLLAIISVIGFVSSLLRPKKTGPEPE